MVYCVGLAFVALLLYGHSLGDFQERLGLPLSMFRDSEPWWVGYGLFALLILLGGCQLLNLALLRRERDALVCTLALVLLVAVALTPSDDGFHLLCSLLLLGLLFGFYAVLLSQARHPCFVPHLLVPAALLLATAGHGYGLWQKGLILYLVVLANVHHYLACRGLLPTPDEQPARRPARSSAPLRRRKVYSLEPGRPWTRQRPTGTTV